MQGWMNDRESYSRARALRARNAEYIQLIQLGLFTCHAHRREEGVCERTFLPFQLFLKEQLEKKLWYF